MIAPAPASRRPVAAAACLAAARRAPRAALALLAAALLLTGCASVSKCPPNTLTQAEQALGWKLLFDGESLEGWQAFGQPGDPAGWAVIDESIVRVGPGPDLITERSFSDFELRVQWRISRGGNSGIMFHVAPDADHTWETGPEMQILDNDRHPDGRSPRTSAGANYALHAPARDATRPVGEWNDVHIVVRGKKVEYWLNGERQCAYELGSPAWEQRVAASKFVDHPRYGREGAGRIALQNHGDRVWFRNVKVLVREPDEG